MTVREQITDDTVGAAREVACEVVAQRWPELVGVEPIMTPRTTHSVGAPLHSPSLAETPNPSEYTFTFASKTKTREGYTKPHVARVTVDSDRRVVKATASK